MYKGVGYIGTIFLPLSKDLNTVESIRSFGVCSDSIQMTVLITDASIYEVFTTY